VNRACLAVREGVAEVEALIVDSECFTGNEGVDKGHATEPLRVASPGAPPEILACDH
jgi:hypothetical protein